MLLWAVNQSQELGLCQVQGDFGADSPAGRAPSITSSPRREQHREISSGRSGEGAGGQEWRLGDRDRSEGGSARGRASWSQTPWPDCPGCSKSARKSEARQR